MGSEVPPIAFIALITKILLMTSVVFVIVCSIKSLLELSDYKMPLATFLVILPVCELVLVSFLSFSKLSHLYGSQNMHITMFM